VTAEVKGKAQSKPSPNGAGPSRAAWQPAKGKKRPLASTAKISRSAPGFDPFAQWDHSSLSWKKGENTSFWIKGQTRQQRDELAAKKLCWLCRSPKHGFPECPERESRFRAKTFCYFPKVAPK